MTPALRASRVERGPPISPSRALTAEPPATSRGKSSRCCSPPTSNVPRLLSVIFSPLASCSRPRTVSEYKTQDFESFSLMPICRVSRHLDRPVPHCPFHSQFFALAPSCPYRKHARDAAAHLVRLDDRLEDSQAPETVCQLLPLQELPPYSTPPFLHNVGVQARRTCRCDSPWPTSPSRPPGQPQTSKSDPDQATNSDRTTSGSPAYNTSEDIQLSQPWLPCTAYCGR